MLMYFKVVPNFPHGKIEKEEFLGRCRWETAHIEAVHVRMSIFFLPF